MIKTKILSLFLTAPILTLGVVSCGKSANNLADLERRTIQLEDSVAFLNRENNTRKEDIKTIKSDISDKMDEFAKVIDEDKETINNLTETIKNLISQVKPSEHDDQEITHIEDSVFYHTTPLSHESEFISVKPYTSATEVSCDILKDEHAQYLQHITTAITKFDCGNINHINISDAGRDAIPIIFNYDIVKNSHGAFIRNIEIPLTNNQNYILLFSDNNAYGTDGQSGTHINNELHYRNIKWLISIFYDPTFNHGVSEKTAMIKSLHDELSKRHITIDEITDNSIENAVNKFRDYLEHISRFVPIPAK